MDQTTPTQQKSSRLPLLSASSQRSTATATNELILSSASRNGVARRNVTSAGSKKYSQSEASMSVTMLEEDELKRKLKEQEQRLSTPVRHVPAAERQSAAHAAAHQVAAFLHGERYNEIPFQTVETRIKWEPFEDDSEVREWTTRANASQQRIERRVEMWRGEWSRLRAARDAPEDKPREQQPAPPASKTAATAASPGTLKRAYEDDLMSMVATPPQAPRPNDSTRGRPPLHPATSATPSAAAPAEDQPARVASPVSDGGAEDAPSTKIAPPLREEGSMGMLPATDDPFQSFIGISAPKQPASRPISARLNRLASIRQTVSPDQRTEYNAQVLRKRRTSSAVSDDVASLLNRLDFAAKDLSVGLAEPVAAESRRGTVLAPGLILKRDFWVDSFARPEVAGVIANAPSFRVVPKFNVCAVASAHLAGIRGILNSITDAHEGRVVWISLREELTVYVNGRCYVVRELSHPQEALPAPAEPEAIENLEKRLSADILEEASGPGNVLIHKETHTGSLITQWESVTKATVVTPREFFETLQSEQKSVHYSRIPFISHGSISSAAFDRVIQVCTQVGPMVPIVFSCLTGRGRSTMGLMIVMIFRLYAARIDFTQFTAKATLVSSNPGVNSLLRLIALLPAGMLHESVVATLCMLTGDQSSLLERITNAFKSDSGSALGRELLQRYCHLVCFSCYLSNEYFAERTKGEPLSYEKWLEEIPELQYVLADVRSVHRLSSEGVTNSSISELDVTKSDVRITKALEERVGHVLTQGTLLVECSSSPGAALSHIPGVQALRQLGAGVPIFSTGPVTVAGRTALHLSIKSAFPSAKRVVWIDVRAEPVVYINSTAFTIWETLNLAAGASSWSRMRMTGDTIDAVERRLKEDIVAEATDSSDREVVSHYVTLPSSGSAPGEEEPTVTPVWVRVRDEDVKTARESFAQTPDASLEHVYHRAPVAGGDEPSDMDLTTVINAAQVVRDDDVVIIHDNEGGLRTTYALNLLTLILAARRGEWTKSLSDLGGPSHLIAQLRHPSVAGGASDLRATTLSLATTFSSSQVDKYASGARIELHIASQLSQMLGAGRLLAAVESCVHVAGRGPQWNLLDNIEDLIARTSAALGGEKTGLERVTLNWIQKYLYLLVVATFLNDYRLYRQAGKALHRNKEGAVVLPSILEYISKHDQISITFAKMREHVKATFKLVSPQNFFLETPDNGTSVARRRGQIITANFGLKADHFPGAQRKGMIPAVHGAPNFRKVEGVNIYGVAIPTVEGVLNVLALLGANPQPYRPAPGEDVDPQMPSIYPQRRVFTPKDEPLTAPPKGATVVWCNMREEPLIYVGNRPFVFRDFSNPYVNVEFTGIDPNRIEDIEKRMRQDVFDEAKLYGDRYLVHDEGAPGQLVGQWEPATVDTIKTVRQLYTELATAGMHVKFWRFPVTDEQAPEEKDFDYLSAAIFPAVLEHLKSPTSRPLSLIFNCQMGRGRTTTGMIVGAMIVGLLMPDYYAYLQDKYPTNVLYPPDASQYDHGNYRCITQLQRLLIDGPTSKHRTDLIVNACSKMQNIRAAIETFKKTVESTEANDGQRSTALHHGKHYLMRYFFLIIFNSYLHEEFDHGSMRLKRTFVQWMASRKELRGWEHHVELK